MKPVSHIGPRSLGVTLRLPEAFLAASSVFGLPPVDVEKCEKVFSFRRCKDEGEWGWETWLNLGQLGLNLFALEVAPFPRHLVEAHAWAIAFAETHGFKPMYRVKLKEPPAPRLRLVSEARP